MSQELLHETVMIDARERGYVTIAEAAKLLRVSHPTIWRWIKAGKLPAYRVGPKTIRIKQVDLAKVIRPVAPRGGVSPVRDAMADHTMSAMRPMTEEERLRGLAVLKELDALQEQMAAERGGQPFTSSVELIEEMREERSRHLESL